MALVLGDFLELSLILIIAAFAIPVSRKLSIIDLPFLVLFGIIFGPVLGVISRSFGIYLMTEFGGVGIGILGIAIILYSESHSINFRIIRREIIRIASLDSLGMVITAILAGFFFSLVTGAPLVIGFIFGAIISPTDPASLIPIFRKMEINEEVSGILVGESLFNDPLGIILVAIGISLVDPTSTYIALFSLIQGSLGVLATVPVYIVIQIAVPAVFGIVLGFLVINLNKLFGFDNLLVGFLLGIVLLEFTLLEAVSFTPFPAVIATGAIVGNYSDKSIFYDREANFQQSLSFLLRAIIFIILGSILTGADFTDYFAIGVAAAVLVIFAARPIAVFISLGVVSRIPSRFKVTRNVQLFMGLTGPRGVVSVVMSLLPYTIGVTENIPILVQWGMPLYVATSFVVIISIILQTVYVPYINKKLLNPAVMTRNNGITTNE